MVYDAFKMVLKAGSEFADLFCGKVTGDFKAELPVYGRSIDVDNMAVPVGRRKGNPAVFCGNKPASVAGAFFLIQLPQIIEADLGKRLLGITDKAPVTDPVMGNTPQGFFGLNDGFSYIMACFQ